jgi:hypothetical protein
MAWRVRHGHMGDHACRDARPKDPAHYASLYDHHLRPFLGSIALRDIDPETVGRWQADRLAAGPRSRRSPTSAGSPRFGPGARLRVWPHSPEPVRRVKRARLPRREEVQALLSATIETMRAALGARDAALLSVLAYAGLRPGEALVSTRAALGRYSGADHPDSTIDLARRGSRHKDAAAPDCATPRIPRRGSARLEGGGASSGRRSARLPRQEWSAVDAGGVLILAPAVVPSSDAGSRARTRAAIRPEA